MDAGDFFDQVDFAFDFGAPAWLGAFPGGEQGAFRAAIFADSNGSKTQGAEDGFDFFVGDIRAHHAKEFGAGQLDFFGSALAGIHIDNAGEQFTASELQDDLGGAAGGEFGGFGIGAAAKARGGFGVKFEDSRGFANSDWFEPGTFDKDIFCREGDFGVGAAHDAADADGARAIAVEDDRHGGIEGALEAVERADFFAGLCAADADAMVADFVVVVGVKRVAKFEHDVVGDIDGVADAGDAGGFEAVFQPFRGRLDFYAANDAGGEAAAKFGRLDFDFCSVGGFCGAFRGLCNEGLEREFVDGAEFTGDSIVAKAIGTIGADFGVDDGAVRAVFHAADVGAGKGEARGDVGG